MITNNRDIIKSDLTFLNRIGVGVLRVENEGLDFGMWYKGLNEIEIDNYDQVAFINDSCILFDRNGLRHILDWVDKNDIEYCGLTDSNQIDYHIQSYFTIAKSSIFQYIKNYYSDNGIINDDSRNIIEVYEIGISKYLIEKGVKIGSYFTHKDYTSPNISIMESVKLIKNGCPLIKKKLLRNSFRDHEKSFLEYHNFNFNTNYKSLIIDKIKNQNINIEFLLEFR